MASPPSGPRMLLLRDPNDSRRLLWRPSRPWERFGARLLAGSLDGRLAAGQPPETGPLVAIRAQTLVSPEQRCVLGAQWRRLLELSRRPSARSGARVPLCRGRIIAAEPVLLEMITALEAPLPVPARGVALAARLLADGAGPLYHRRSTTGLLDAVRVVTAALDPSTSLVPSA